MPQLLRKAVSKIDNRGMLLVFPINNKKEPPSIWSEFYPRSEMRWEWDEGGDNRVASLWHLREELSRSQKVIYSKWYKGRATFFSKPVFTAMLSLFIPSARAISPESRDLLTLLLETSPLSTKQLKKEMKLEGRFNEALYNKSLKDLWTRLLIVGFGEVDDGAFPSLAVGATELMFEDIWAEALTLKPAKAERFIRHTLANNPLFFKEFQKIQSQIAKVLPAPLLKERKVIRGVDLITSRR